MRALNRTVIGALLLCFLLSGNSAQAESLSSATLATGFTFTHDLTLGIRGDEVSALQQFLITGGFLKIPAPTGYFGPLTKTTLGAWQASVGISPATGFFGPISRGKINSIGRSAPIEAVPAQSQGSVGTTTPTVGTTSEAIVHNENRSSTRLRIPKISVDAIVQDMGLTPDGVMEIPKNIVDVGWFTGSPHPGEKGAAILTGHVAQIRGGILTKQGVFYNLNQLRAGDDLYVLNDKGESIAFVVRESRVYDPTADATSVFTSGDGGAHLNLITCDGIWNPGQLSYTQRLVIFADAVS